MLRSLMGQVRRGIAEGRKLSPEEADELVARGPFLAREALEEGLVDRLAYRDEVYAAMEEKAEGEISLLYLSEYRRRTGGPYSGSKRIGLIYGVGRIVRGKSRHSPLGGVIMGSETVSAAFRAAIRDDSVRAVVFRIDSPGGSYVASDVIRREVARARKAGKPVVVSMSGVAASGGYYAALPADRILAHPGTLTGSIGVLGGKMITSDLWEKLKVNWEGVSTHENADFWSATSDYTPEQWKKLQQRLDEIYGDFVRKVSESRGLDMGAVREAAQGKVWTGEDALALGLVDALGGLAQAVRAAGEAAGIEEEAVDLVLLPPRRSLWQRLLAPPPDSSEERFTGGMDLREALEAEARFLRAAAGSVLPDQALWMGPVPAVE
jgi:protease-4